jgi:V/A-type H+-transporting ATPase subunit C
MASDWDYTYAVARIRVLETQLLSDSDVGSMIAMKDENAVLSFLKDKGWGDAVSGNDPVKVLEAEEKKIWKLMKELGVDFSVFNVLSYPNLYHNLKAAVKGVCTSDDSPSAFYTDDRYGREEMMRILRDKDYSALPVHMRLCAEEAYESMLHSRDGQMCDIIIDRACLDAMEAEGKKSKDRIISDYAESVVDVTNIKVAVRAAKTKKSLEFLHKALAPCKAFDVRQLAQAASSGEDALMDFLNSAGFAEAAEALKSSPSAFERWCDNQTIETIKPQKYQVCTVGPLVAYVLARENEIKTARIILTCKANGLPEEEIRERTREMYV